MQENDPIATKQEASHIIDVTTATFVSEVIERSAQVPVIVDFWAPWCEPCKTLGPTLEKVVNEAKGAVVMAKINIDEAQEIAAQMQIRSVPTVVAFVAGRPVDAFAGVKTETEIKEFIAKVAPDIGPTEIEEILLFANTAFEQGDFQDAGGAYSQALQIDAKNLPALAGLSSSLIKMGDLEAAEQVLGGAHEPNDPAIKAVQAALDTAKQVGELGDIKELEMTVENNLDDYQARFDFALALWAKEERDLAADHLLFIIAADKEWEQDGARKQLLKFFEMAGPMDPFTISARRKLSSLLFA